MHPSDFTSDIALPVLDPSELYGGKLVAAMDRQHPRALTSRHRDFLLSLVSAEPQWELMPFDNLRHLPALQRKLLNLRKLKMRDAGRFAAQRDELAAKFENLT